MSRSTASPPPERGVLPEGRPRPGVLTLRIPVAESAKPRKVPITEGADRLTIEAQTAQAST